MSSSPPATGILTFLFTDIEGSTARWDTQREAMAGALVPSPGCASQATERRLRWGRSSEIDA